MKANQIVICGFFSLSCGVLQAKEITVQLGWMNIQPCSKVEWNQGYNATTRWGDQRLIGYAKVKVPDQHSVKSDIEQCALEAVGACGISALLASPAACEPAFEYQFQSCLSNKSSEYFNLRLEAKSKCVYH